MFLFKASGKTYRRVLRERVHAFQHSPAQVRGDELILLSKNKEDCAMLERQVQAVAKLRRVRRATATELNAWFPDVRAADRWKYAIELYWVRSLPSPFNLSAVPGLNEKRYRPVQGFAMLEDGDDLSVVKYLAESNTEVLLDIVNNADPEVDAS